MRWPAEWEPHEAVWIGFPGDPVEWPIGLSEAQSEVAAFANAVSDAGAGEQVLLVCRSDADANIATKMVDRSVRIIVEPFGDIWLRDTGPIVKVAEHKHIATCFEFNGWGRKFEMSGDHDIGERLANRLALTRQHCNWVLEGGAIEGNGTGLILTTEQCVLNSNRNNNIPKPEAEANLNASLGCEKVIWLDEGLKGDHTDGHIDNLARFITKSTVAIPLSDQADDPNTIVFEAATKACTDAGLGVVHLPSVGKYLVGKDVAPASYMNFYIGNNAVIVPQYGASNDNRAVDSIAALFPDRKTIGLSSKALLRGGGSFHCISQQIPGA